jgi:hypothetical protein
VEKASGLPNKNQIMELLANLILTARPLPEMVNSDEFTAEDRARLRELAQRDGVFDLHNHLYGLCSETARREQQKQRQKK